MITRSIGLPAVVAANLLAGLCCCEVNAEVVVLRSGGRVEGTVANPGRARTDPVAITAAHGLRLILNPGQVARIVVKTDVQKQYEAALPKVPNTVEGQWEMAQWCAEAGLDDERKTHLAAILRLDPDHAEARRILGYSKFGEEWMKPDEWMRSRGYVQFGGEWCLPHEIEMFKQAREWELATKRWRKDIKTWIGWIADNGRKSQAGWENLQQIRDEAAAPALLEALSNASLPRRLRLECLERLTRMPARHSTSTLIKLAMKDKDEEISDKCLDELKRQRSTVALQAFVKDLKSKDNKVVRRAAYCLGVLGDVEATVPLIDALVTPHKYAITVGGAPGQIGAGFGGPTDGSGGGGGGSFNFGSPKPQIKTFQIKNDETLAALTSLHPGVNFHYDEKQWKAWAIETRTTPDMDLRRGE